MLVRVPQTLPWLLASIALATSLLRGVLLVKKTVYTEALVAVTKKLLHERRFDRVAKLAAFIDATPAGAALLATTQKALSFSGKSDASEIVTRAAARAEWERAYDAAMRPIFETRWMALVSVVAGISGIGAALTTSPPIVVAAVMGAAALVGVALGVRWMSKLVEAGRAIDALLPSFVEAARSPASSVEPSGGSASPPAET